MKITLTEQIDEAFQKGGLSFMQAREIFDLWNQRKDLDSCRIALLSDSIKVDNSKKLKRLTDKIVAILDKVKLTASERLGVAEQGMKRFK